MAFDTFIKIKDIDGESTDEKHAKWIEIDGFSWGMASQATMASGTSGLTAGKVQMSSFSITKLTDAASVKLASAAASGKHIETMDVEVCASAGERHTFVVFKFSEVMIEAIQWSGAAGGTDRPVETVSFAFGKVTWEYTPLTKEGKAGTKVGPEGWNVTTNTKV